MVCPHDGSLGWPHTEESEPGNRAWPHEKNGVWEILQRCIALHHQTNYMWQQPPWTKRWTMVQRANVLFLSPSLRS